MPATAIAKSFSSGPMASPLTMGTRRVVSPGTRYSSSTRQLDKPITRNFRLRLISELDSTCNDSKVFRTQFSVKDVWSGGARYQGWYAQLRAGLDEFSLYRV